MKRTKVSELQEQHKQLNGQKVLLKGWVHTMRKQSKFAFLVLREITGTVQVFIDQSELLKIAETLPSESVVQIEGMVKVEKQAPGGFEVLATAITVLSKPVEELPFQVYEKGEEPELPLRLDYRWLDLRKPKKALIFKIWTSMGNI